MLADGTGPIRGLDGYADRRDPLRSPRPLRRPPPLVGRRGVGAAPARRAAVRAAGAGRASAGGFILDDLESARATAPARGRARAAAVGARRRLPQRHARGRHAGVRARRGRGHRATSPTRPTSPASCRTRSRRARCRDDGHTAYDIVLARPAARRLAGRGPDPRGTRSRSAARAEGRARRRPGVLRRRPARVRGGPAAQRGHLAAARGARAAARVRQRSSRPASRSRSAARRCSSRSPRSSSSRRSTPMSIFVLNLATLLGLGPGRRLLAADDQPLPRGAGARAAAGTERRRRIAVVGRRSRRPAGPCSSPA